MAGGNYNNGGIQPAHLSAWCKVNLGFARTTPIHSQTGVSLPRVESNPVVGLLRDGLSGGEYFLVENRGKIGFDNTSAIHPGLIIYHIYNDSPGNNSVNHPHPVVRIEEADGNDSLGFMSTTRSEAGDVWTSTSGLVGGFSDQTDNLATSAMLYQPNPEPYQTNLFYTRSNNPAYYTYHTLNNFSAPGSNMTFDATTLKPAAPAQFALPTDYPVAWRACSEATIYEIQEGTNAILTSLADGAEDAEAMFENWYLGGKVQRVLTNASYAGSYSYALLPGNGTVHHMTLQKSFKVTTNTVASFYFMSHVATGNGYLKFQISNDDGETWKTLVTTNGFVDPWKSFSSDFAALNAHGINAGDTCIIRFLADMERTFGWSDFPRFGIALDDISITGTEIEGYDGWTTLDNNVTSTSYNITGKTNGVYAYRIQAFANGAWQGYGSVGETTVGTNHAPTFVGDPVAGADANIGSAYGSSLAILATDLDANDVLTYSKISGPDWLQVSTNGMLWGTPLPGDLGTNTFTVRVTDLAATYAEAQLVIVVGVPVTPLSSDLVAYLPFDSDFLDYSGQQNHPGLINANVRVSGYLGGNAYLLTNGGYLSFGQASDFHFPNTSLGNTQSYSIAFWSKIPPGSFDGAPPYIANKDWSSDTTTGWVLAAGPNFGGDGFFQMSFKESNANLREYDSGNTALVNGNWHHYLVVFQRDAPRTCFTYIDGTLADSRTMFATGVNIDADGLPVNIGQDGAGTGARGTWTNALMDDFAFWRRSLTATEVSAIYSAGTNGYSMAYAQAAPVITALSPGGILPSGTSLIVTAAVYSATAPVFQWRLNGIPISGATGAAYTNANPTGADFGTYDVIVTNLYAGITSAGIFITNLPPAATDSVILSVSYDGGAASITFSGTPGATYALQYVENLNGTWDPVGGNVTLPGIGQPSAGMATVEHTPAPNNGAYYRTLFISNP